MNATEILENAKKYSQKESSDFLVNLTKGTLNGALTGGFLGAGIGLFKSYNIYASILVGIVIGGAISNISIKFKQ